MVELQRQGGGVGIHLYKVQGVEHGLQDRPGLGQLGVQDDDGGPQGVAAVQLLYEVMEAFLSPTHYHMIPQLSNLFSATYLH